MPDMTPEERAQIPKLDGDQNVRDNASGRFTEEARRVTEPEAVTVERDKLDTERHVDDRVEPPIEDDDKTILKIVEGKLALADSPQDAASVRAQVMILVDTAIYDAGLEPELKVEDLTFSQALELLLNGMAIHNDEWPEKDLWIRIEHRDESLGTPPYTFISRPDGGRGPWSPTGRDMLSSKWRAA
jgi:hypothetical protein